MALRNLGGEREPCPIEFLTEKIVRTWGLPFEFRSCFIICKGGGAYKNINAGDDEYGKYTGFVLDPGKAPAPAPWNLKF